MNDTDYMELAYKEALNVQDEKEYPVGALVLLNGEIISSSRNTVQENYDPTAHAEINAIRAACKKISSDKLKGATLYTTLYPCPMCEGAIKETGIEKVVYGAEPYKWVREVKFRDGTIEFTGPIMNEECRKLFADKLKALGEEYVINYENS